MTITEIAALSGVSIGTVDRVLHCRGRVSPETAKKIEAVIEKYKYTPNPIARQLQRNRAYRFCALVPRRDQDSGYWDLAIRGIHLEDTEVVSMGVKTEIIEYDHFDTAAFKKATRKILKDAPDGLILPPIWPEVDRPFTEELDKKGIPYVFFDADLSGTRPLCTINQDPFRSGYFAGKLLHLFAGRITGPVAIQWAPLNQNIRGRRAGFLRYAEEQGFRGLVKDCPEDREGMMLKAGDVEHFLRKQRNLQGIFVSYADVREAAEAAQSRRKQGNFYIIGYDMVPDNHRLLKEGRIDAVITQRPQGQGRLALLSLYRHVVLGQAVEPKIEMPIEVYFKENVPEDYTFSSYQMLAK
ncbi:transcriptional regulator [Spirochaetia bacterium]|nr:transcriptional regulator [Spirochaetia bacterium]